MGDFQRLLNEAAAAGRAVVVDFTADWCPPSRLIAPTFKELASKHKDMDFVKVDVDSNKQVAQHYGVRAMPTFKLFLERREVGSVRGAKEDELRRLCARHSVSATAASLSSAPVFRPHIHSHPLMLNQRGQVAQKQCDRCGDIGAEYTCVHGSRCDFDVCEDCFEDPPMRQPHRRGAAGFGMPLDMADILLDERDPFTDRPSPWGRGAGMRPW